MEGVGKLLRVWMTMKATSTILLQPSMVVSEIDPPTREQATTKKSTMADQGARPMFAFKKKSICRQACIMLLTKRQGRL